MFTAFDHRKIIRLICLAWLIMKLICMKLWLADRLFPLIPVQETLLGLPAYVHSSLFYCSLLCMLLILFFPNRKMLLLLLVLELVSCMLDQNRWQPWEYQFIFMLSAVLFCKEEKRILFSWQLIIAALYFFSGLSKLNSAFIHDIWQHLILHKWLGADAVNSWVTRAGYLLPLVEMMAGLALLVNKTRKPAVVVLTCMHLLILLLLGPTGLNRNAVIWPWNILMPVLLLFLFYNRRVEAGFFHFQHPFNWLVLLAWWVMPFFQRAGYWDRYLSAVLYSGGVEQLYICTDDPLTRNQMASYMDKEFSIIPCSPVLSVYKWGMKEMNTAPYPEPRIQQAIIKAWNKRYPNNNDRFYLFTSGYAPTVRATGKE